MQMESLTPFGSILLIVLGSIVAFLLLFLFVLFFIYVPIKQKYGIVKKQSDIEGYNYEDFHQKQRPFLSQIDEIFKEKGFIQCGYYTLKRGTRLYLAVYKNSDLRVTGVVVFTKAFHLRDRIRVIHSSFYTEFLSGKEVTTSNNSKHMTNFPKPQDIEVFVFPQIRDIRKLYSVHMTLVDRYFSQDKLSNDNCEKDFIQEFNDDTAKILEQQIVTGYLYANREQDSYRFTWKGTFLVTYRQIWAHLPIHMLYLRIKAAFMLKRLATSFENK